jgi:chitin disaccharide deacetylase
MKLFLSLLSLTAFAQGPRLIVRGDDMGYTHSGNMALIKAYEEGIEKSIEVIVPSPWFPEAVKLLKEHPGVDVGVHLAITSEWDNVKWRPLTDCRSLTDENGYFLPMVYPNPNYPGLAITERAWKLADVEKEFRAQIEMARRLIPRVSHISSHMWCTGIDDEVRALTKRLAREYGIDIDLDELGIENIRYDGPSATLREKEDSFIRALGKLAKGKTYMFLDHPGFDNDELRAVHHVGYENVAADRQGVTDLFTSEKVKRAIAEKGIIVIGYGEAGK